MIKIDDVLFLSKVEMTKTSSLEKTPSIHTRTANKTTTRRAILTVAEQLFSTKGFAETRAEEIAKKAGVAVGTIYLHFKDKEGLLNEILLEATEELRLKIAKVYQTSPHDTQSLVRAQVETIVDYVEEHKKIAGFVLNAVLGGHPVGRSMLERAVGQVETSIRQAQLQGGCLEDVDPHLAARAEVQMSLGLLAWWAKDTRRATKESLVDILAKFLSAALQVQN